MIDKEYLSQCSERYKADLKGNIMPFWIEKGLDPVYGGDIHASTGRAT